MTDREMLRAAIVFGWGRSGQGFNQEIDGLDDCDPQFDLWLAAFLKEQAK